MATRKLGCINLYVVQMKLKNCIRAQGINKLWQLLEKSTHILSFVVFTFELAFESFKGFGDASETLDITNASLNFHELLKINIMDQCIKPKVPLDQQLSYKANSSTKPIH